MQSYEAAGGYGLPAYYDMGLAAEGYGAGNLMAAYGLQNALATQQGLAAFGALGGMGAGRGMMGGRGRGGMMGRGGMGARGRGGAGGAARGGGGMRGGRGGAAGGKMMGRGRGGAGGGQRFNPMGAGGAPKQKIVNGSEGELGHIVFAYNIGEQTTEEDVTALFSLYGTVAKVDVIWDYAKNITKGYAFITMPNYEEAEYAIQQLNGYNYAGKPLQVKFKTDKGDGKNKQ